jgi:exopolysaccharide biosynthesis polyprenyl glycosylphosphotransferase
VGNGLVNELREVKPREAGSSTTRDVRAPKPALVRGFVIRMETLRRLLRFTVLAALDVAGIFLAIWTALELKAAVNGKSDLSLTFSQTKHWAPLACLVTVLLFARSRMYGDRPVRPGFAGIVGSLCQVTAVIFLYAIIQGQHFSSYYIFYGTLFFAIAYVSLFRWSFDWVTWKILSAAGYRRRAVLVGSGLQIDAVAHALGGGQHSQLDPVGFVSLTPREGNGLQDLGPLDRLEEHFGEIDEVLIADPDFPQEEAVDLVDRCHRAGIRVRVAPSTMEILMDRVEFIPGQTVPLFELKPPVFEGIDFVVKRTFDIAVAALLLVVLGPLLLLAALAVKLTSRGPVVYRSKRRGLGGKPFSCFKFRTMYENADARQADLEQHNEQAGAIFKIKDDPRVTPVGRFLRRWSIDEMPQLLNVLKGDMSLVGPRPLPERDYERLEDWHRKRYLVLPGMTGLWQVSGRSELDFDELVRLDFLYLERWSVFLDLSIMLKTIPAVFRTTGAW